MQGEPRQRYWFKYAPVLVFGLKKLLCLPRPALCHLASGQFHIVVKWLTLIRDQRMRVVVRPADKAIVALTANLNSPAVSLLGLLSGS